MNIIRRFPVTASFPALAVPALVVSVASGRTPWWAVPAVAAVVVVATLGIAVGEARDRGESSPRLETAWQVALVGMCVAFLASLALSGLAGGGGS